jgi:hypothetical protein
VTSAAEGPTVRSLLEAYERGELPFDALLGALAQADYFEHPPAANLAEHYAQAEGPPEDNEFFWVDSAWDRGILNDVQRQAICDAIDAHHQGANKTGAIEN